MPKKADAIKGKMVGVEPPSLKIIWLLYVYAQYLLSRADLSWRFAE